MTSKRLRSLGATKARAVTTRVSADEHAGVRAHAESRGTTISGLIHELIAVAHRDLATQPTPYAEKYLSAKLTPDEIEKMNEVAQAAGMEPLAWLALMLLLSTEVGSGKELMRQVRAIKARKRRAAPRS